MGTSNSISTPRPPPGDEFDDGVVDGLSSVVGFASVVQRLRSIVVNPVTSAWAGVPGVVPPSGILLYGPPGPAAAALRAAVARQLRAPQISASALNEGQSVAVGPVIIDVDIVDDVHLAGNGRSVVDRLLDRLAEVPAVERPLPIAISVAPWHLDSSLLATGRFDRLVFVPPPDWAARTAVFEAAFGRARPDLMVGIPLLAAATVGWSGADVDELLDEFGTGPALGARSEIDRSSGLLDVVSIVVPRTRSWAGRARELADRRAGDGMLDDLLAWLRRAE